MEKTHQPKPVLINAPRIIIKIILHGHVLINALNSHLTTQILTSKYVLINVELKRINLPMTQTELVSHNARQMNLLIITQGAAFLNAF